MNTYSPEMEMLDLQPYRMPTDILEQIDQLSTERRQLLQQLAESPQDPKIKARMGEIDQRLEELWLQRRKELRQTS